MFGGSTRTHKLEAQVVASGTDKFERDMRGAKSSIISLEDAALGAGAALAGIAAGGFAKAIGAASEYETALVELEKVTDRTTVEKLNSELLEMSKIIPLTATELADIAAQAGQFGVRGSENIAKFTEAVSKMAIATDLTVEEAGTAFAKLANLTGTPIERVSDLGSAINTLSNIAATSSGEIVDNMLRSSASLTQLGLNQPQIISLAGTLNAVSESSERAGTRLATLAMEMVDPRKVADLAGALGMTVTEFEHIRDTAPYELIRDMATEFANNTDKAKALSGVLGTTSRRALAGLAQNLGGLDEALEATSEQFAHGTSLEEEFIKASDTFSNQLQLLKNNVTAVGIQLGQAFLPSLTNVLRGVSSAVGRFAEWNAKMDNMPAKIALVGTAITGVTLAATGLALKFGIATTAMGAFGTAIGGVLLPLAAVGGAIYAYQNNLGGMRDTTNRVVGEISQAWHDTLPRIREFLIDEFGFWPNLVEGALSRIGEDFTETFLGMEGDAKGSTSRIGAMLQAWGPMIYGPIKVGAELADFWFRTFLDTAERTVRGVLALIRGDWASAWGNFTAIPQSAISNLELAVRDMPLPDWISAPLLTALNVWSDGWGEIQITGYEAAQGLQEKVGTPMQFMMSVLGGAFENLKEAAMDAWGALTWLHTTVWPPVRAVLTPLAGKIRELAQTFGFLDEDMKPTVKTIGTVGIALATLMGVGGPIPLVIGGVVALYQAWHDNLFGIQDRVNGFTTYVKDALTTHGDYINSLANGAIAGLKDAYEDVRASAMDAYDGFMYLVDTVWPPIRDILSPFTTKLGELGQKFGFLDDKMRPTIQTIGSVGFALMALTGVGGPIGLVIGGVIALSKAWNDNLFGIQDRVDEFTSYVEGALETHAPTIKAINQGIVDTLEDAWEFATVDIVGYVGTATSAIQTKWDEMKPAVETTVTNTTTNIKTEWENLKPELEQTATDIKNGLITVFELLNEEFGPVITEFETTAIDTIEEIRRSSEIESPKITENLTSAFADATPIITDLLGFLAVGVVKPSLKRITRLADIHGGETHAELLETYTAISEDVAATMDVLEREWQQHKKWVLPFAYVLFDALGGIFEFGLDTMATAFNLGLNVIQRDWEDFNDTLDSYVRRNLRGIKQFFGRWGGELLKIISPKLENLHNRFDQWVTNTSGKITGFYDDTTRKTRNGLQSVGDTTNTKLGAVHNRWVQWKTNTGTQIQNFWSDTDRWFTNGFNEAKRLTSTSLEAIHNRWKQWKKNTTDAIRGWVEDTIKWFKNLDNRLIGGSIVPEMLDAIHKRFGQFFANTLARTQTWKSNTERAYEGMKTNLKNKTNTATEDMHGRWNQFFANTSNRTQAWKTGTENKFDGLKSNLKSKTNTLGRDMHSRWNQFFDNTASRTATWKSGTESKWENLRSNLKSKSDTLGRQVHSAFTTMFSDTESRATTWKSRMESKNRNTLSNMTSKAWSWVPNFKRPFNNAMDDIEGRFEKMKKEVVGDSIVPEMLRDLIREAEPWAGEFTAPFKRAVNNIIAEFERARKQSAAKTKGIKKATKSNVAGVSSEARKIFENEIWSGTWAFDAPKTGRRHAEALRRGVKGFTGEYRGNGRTNNMAANFAALQRAGLLPRSKENVLSSWNSFYEDRFKHQKMYRDKYGYDMDPTEAALSRFINSWKHSPFEMAKGGIVDGPFNAIIGEAGAEAVVPLDKLPALMAEAARRGGVSGPQVVVNVDRIEANSRREGRDAMSGLLDEADAYLRRR